MGTPGIALDHVSKKFRRGERHNSLRDLIPALVRGTLARRDAGDLLGDQEFWALRDVSFQVRPGEALGIIGSNGAGKSTVLKILSRIMKPTVGDCRIEGRVGALIEIAAGFHPDLTGRQNVYLQGAIMGMRRNEVDRKFDDIVDFSGMTDFIDTPVKRYSSGMSARLGFAIAAHLDPDVLLIDEVLSVGDFAFQQRAFERLKEVVDRGVPTIVVSHQLERVAALCTHVVVLSHGTVARYGSAAESIAAYVTEGSGASVGEDNGTGLRLVGIDLVSETVRSGERMTLMLTGVRDHADESALVTLAIRSVKTGQIVYSTDHARCGAGELPCGVFQLEASLQFNVPAGLYVIETATLGAAGRRPVQGPSRVVEIVDGALFQGVAQFNAAVRFARTVER